MNTEGTITYQDADGRERRVQCSGGLNALRDRDGGLRIQGVVNVDAADAEAMRAVMERETQDPEAHLVRYDGTVRSDEGDRSEVVHDAPLRVQAVTGDGTVRLESDGPAD